MPRVQWPLWQDRPCVQVVLTLTATEQPFLRTLIADTGAGVRYARFEIILDEMDCRRCGGLPHGLVILHGAYSGSFPIYEMTCSFPHWDLPSASTRSAFLRCRRGLTASPVSAFSIASPTAILAIPVSSAWNVDRSS